MTSKKQLKEQSTARATTIMMLYNTAKGSISDKQNADYFGLIKGHTDEQLVADVKAAGFTYDYTTKIINFIKSTKPGNLHTTTWHVYTIADDYKSYTQQDETLPRIIAA